MVEIKVSMDRSVELTDQYLRDLYDCGFSGPSSAKIEPEEPISKIAAALNVAATITVGTSGGEAEDVAVLHKALSHLIDTYLRMKDIKYVAK